MTAFGSSTSFRACTRRRRLNRPLVFAIILKLLLQPALRVLERLHIPRLPAALLLILALFGTIVGLGNGHFRPGPYLGSQASGGHSSARGVAEFHAGTYQCTATVLQHVEDIGGTAPSPKAAVSERGAALLTTLFTGTRNVASGFFTTVSAIERQERGEWAGARFPPPRSGRQSSYRKHRQETGVAEATKRAQLCCLLRQIGIAGCAAEPLPAPNTSAAPLSSCAFHEVI